LHLPSCGFLLSMIQEWRSGARIGPGLKLNNRFDVVQSKFVNIAVQERQLEDSQEIRFTREEKVGSCCKSIESHNNSGVCTLKNHSEV
jgi:hypothetical protein